MSNRLRSWLLVLAAVMLFGKLADLRPHLHASEFYCPACAVATSRREVLDCSDTVFGYAGQSGGDPQKLAIVESEAVVVAVFPTVTPNAQAPTWAKLPPWRSPPSVDRGRAPDVPRGPPFLT